MTSELLTLDTITRAAMCFNGYCYFDVYTYRYKAVFRYNGPVHNVCQHELLYEMMIKSLRTYSVEDTVGMLRHIAIKHMQCMSVWDIFRQSLIDNRKINETADQVNRY